MTIDLQERLTVALDLIASTDPVLRPLAEFRHACVAAAALRQRMHYDRANNIMRAAHERVWQHLFSRHSQPRVKRHRVRVYELLRKVQREAGA